jgi:RHS repeat-associated protein
LNQTNYTLHNVINVPHGTINTLPGNANDYAKIATDYVDNKIYQDKVLKMILLPEGYWQNGVFYDYLKDHLGNNRVVVDGSGTVKEKSNYYPSGMRFLESTSHSAALPYRHSGKELEAMNGLNQYDFGARRRGTGLPIWTTMDPLAEKYYSISPYVFCNNNPVRFVDPTGLAPIYDPDGNFLGTDDEGLRGNAIVMSTENFSQGMAHKDASGYYRDMNNEDAYKKMNEHYGNLPNRPDYDGKLTLGEANDWYRNGNGQPLYVDASKIDLSPVTTKDLTLGGKRAINFVSPQNANLETGLVYGTLTLTLTNENKGTVEIGQNNKIDVYDFDQQKGRTFRNIATKIGETLAGKGTAYTIYGYGIGIVKVKK